MHRTASDIAYRGELQDLLPELRDVRFGSLAAPQNSTILTAAFGRIADMNLARFDENQWAPFLLLLSATVPWTW